MTRHRATAPSLMTTLMRATLMLAALLTAPPAHAAATEAPAGAAGKPLTIGITSGSAPYVYSIREGTGLDFDILRAITARMDRSVTFMPVPYARRSLVLQSRKVDAVTFWTKPKDVACSASLPYRYWRNALFNVHRKGTPETPASHIGIFMGSEHLRGEVEAIGLQYDSLQRIYTINSAVRMMLYGRLDGYIGDYPTVLYNFHTQDPKGEYEAKIRHFFPPRPQRLCFTDPADAKAFDRALTALLKADPEALNAITRRHGLTESITPPLVK